MEETIEYIFTQALFNVKILWRGEIFYTNNYLIQYYIVNSIKRL